MESFNNIAIFLNKITNVLVWLGKNVLLDFHGNWWMLIPFIAWWLLLTQPKTIDKGWEFIGKLSPLGGGILKGAKTLFLFLAKHVVITIIVVILLAIVLTSTKLSAGSILSVFFICFLLTQTKPLRFMVTLSIMNLMTSPNAGLRFLANFFEMKFPEGPYTTIDLIPMVDPYPLQHSTMIQWSTAWSAIPLLAGWWLFLRDKAAREKNSKLIKDKGWWKGLFHIVFEDFLPKDDGKWNCAHTLHSGKRCGHKNDKDAQYCGACGRINPKATRNHSGKGGCRRVGIPWDADSCDGCGAVLTPLPTQRGQQVAETPAPRPRREPPTQAEAPRPATRKCPNCSVKQPTNAKFCGECGEPMTRKKKATTARTGTGQGSPPAGNGQQQPAANANAGAPPAGTTPAQPAANAQPAAQTPPPPNPPPPGGQASPPIVEGDGDGLEDLLGG